MTKISVCLATYNGEKFIERQLLSILSQLKENDEVIVSDDNSSDATLSIVSKIGDNRVKVYINKEQAGPVHNFEHALKRATGNYIFLADQDDVWEANKVEVVQLLLADYDLVLSDCQVVDESDKIIYPSFFKHRDSKPGFWHNIYKNSYVGCCMAFRHEVLLYALPFPNYIHMHDWWIGLLVEIKGEVFFYPRPLIKYVRHGKNASPTGSAKQGYGFLKQFKNRSFLLLGLLTRLSASLK